MTQEQRLDEAIDQHKNSTGSFPAKITMHPTDLVELRKEFCKSAKPQDSKTFYVKREGVIQLLYDSKVEKGTYLMQ